MRQSRFTSNPYRSALAITRKYAVRDSDGEVVKHGGKVVFRTRKAADAARLELLANCGWRRHSYRCRDDNSHFHISRKREFGTEGTLIQRATLGEFRNTSLADQLARRGIEGSEGSA